MLNEKIKRLRGEGKSISDIGRIVGLPDIEVEYQIRHPGCTQHMAEGTKKKISAALKARYAKPGREEQRRHLPPRRGFKGVSTLYGVRWVANIVVDGKKRSLGIFDSKEEAALAYNEGVDIFYDGKGYKNTVDESLVVKKINTLKVQKIKEPKKKVAFVDRPPKTGFKGVYTYGPKWQAQIRLNQKQKFLGIFDTPELAAAAYNKALDEYYGGAGWRNPV